MILQIPSLIEPPFRKKSHDNMWWQLVDARNSGPYYFNATTQVTKWDKPVDADIIPLAKLQASPHRTHRHNCIT